MAAVSKSPANWLALGAGTDVHEGEARGTAEEVSALFGQLRGPLLRYLQSLGLEAADGEDVLQEIFLSLFRHLQRGRSRDNLRGWLFRSAHNLALRRRMRHGRNTSITEICEAGLSRADPSLNPEELLLLRHRQERLRRVVYALSERDRCCLSLRAEGLRYREIAEVLGMSLGAVALSLSRSLGKLATVDEG